MTRRSVAITVGAMSLATACSRPLPRIACTPGALSACFGISTTFTPAAGDSTIVTIRVQNLQGSTSHDNTAWSQLLYLRVYRNSNPSLKFPQTGPFTPTWDPSVAAIGPGAPGTGWHNTGASFPSFVSEWVGVGGSYGANVGYVAGRDTTYNEVAKVGAGLRTYTHGAAPGWVTFTFRAGHPVTAADVSVGLSAWASAQPASGLPVPSQVSCVVIVVNGGVSNCNFFPYHFP